MKNIHYRYAHDNVCCVDYIIINFKEMNISIEHEYIYRTWYWSAYILLNNPKPFIVDPFHKYYEYHSNLKYL